MVRLDGFFQNLIRSLDLEAEFAHTFLVSLDEVFAVLFALFHDAFMKEREVC